MSNLSRYQHPRFARAYARISQVAEARGTAEHRASTLAGLSGRVLEVGAGNGLNFAHYPGTVTEVIAVEPDDVLRELAERSAARAPVPVRLVAGHAGDLPVADGGVDGAVASLVLCSVPDLPAALRELYRVLRPGGALHFYEHVRSASRWRGLLQDVVSPLWSVEAGGCHLNRDPVAALRTAGFAIERTDRFGFAPSPGVPAQAHVIGVAHRPPR